MKQLVQHIARIMLAALVVYGSVGVHVYVYSCNQHSHQALLSFDGHEHCLCETPNMGTMSCCSLPEKGEEHQGNTPYKAVFDNNDCCTMQAQELALDNFASAQEGIPLSLLYNLLATVLPTGSMMCKGCHATALANALDYPIPMHTTPVIYLHGQLRL